MIQDVGLMIQDPGNLKTALKGNIFLISTPAHNLTASAVELWTESVTGENKVTINYRNYLDLFSTC